MQKQKEKNKKMKICGNNKNKLFKKWLKKQSQLMREIQQRE